MAVHLPTCAYAYRPRTLPICVVVRHVSLIYQTLVLEILRIPFRWIVNNAAIVLHLGIDEAERRPVRDVVSVARRRRRSIVIARRFPIVLVVQIHLHHVLQYRRIDVVRFFAIVVRTIIRERRVHDDRDCGEAAATAVIGNARRRDVRGWDYQ